MVNGINSVLKFFYDLCKVPRGSFNPSKIIPYLKNLIESFGYSVDVDQYNNIFFIIPASHGYEDRPSILVQAHTDMVAVKTDNSNHNFEVDPIQVVEKDGWLHAVDTSLGSDNGIGVSYILAIASDKHIKHPKLEILLSWNEEVSPSAIDFFDMNKITSNYMINLDNEEFSRADAGCAGVKSYDSIYTLTKTKLPINYEIYDLDIKGLFGGHSGGNISAMRLNAIYFLNNILFNILDKKIPFSIVDLQNNNAYNVIPFKSHAIIAFKKNYLNKINDIVNEVTSKFKKIYINEKDLQVTFTKNTNKFVNSLDKKSTEKIINILELYPKPISLFNEQNNMYEVSANIAKYYLTDNKVTIGFSVRAVDNEEYSIIENEIKALDNIINIKAEYKSCVSSVAWKPSTNKKLEDIFKYYFNEECGFTPTVGVCAGGLESGLVVYKKPNIVALSIGPNIINPHSTNEACNISTVEKIFNVLLNILKNFK